jgi:uncharacterized protein YdeI (YjbR/CyaY-like superfamily)
MAAGKTPGPTFFRTPAQLRQWFEKNHAAAAMLWVGFHKVGSGKKSITWPESVDEALCVGWIDGLRKGLDETSYMIRFSPRKPGSIWSAINIGRVKALTAARRMKPAGEKAFGARTERKSVIYSYEQKPHTLPASYAARLRRNASAWRFFQAQAPWYRQKASWWVASAKKEETRAKRLAKLIAESAQGRLI